MMRLKPREFGFSESKKQKLGTPNRRSNNAGQ
jgi:hypothetical protein